MKRGIAALAALAMIGLPLSGCESDGGGAAGGGFAKRISALTGKVGGLKGAKAKISAFVGKQQFNAVVDKATGTFRIDNLPPGAKTLVVEQDGKSRTVKFPVSNQKTKMSGVIPETRVKAEAVDLGDLKVSQAGDYIESTVNPFESWIDSDGDGMFDFLDDDIDDDGVFNWEDDSLWGEEWSEYADWGWEDDWYDDEWDCDGDGEAAWEDGDDSCESFWDWEDEYWDSDDYDSYWDDEECDPEFDAGCDDFGDWDDDGDDGDDWDDDGDDSGDDGDDGDDW